MKVKVTEIFADRFRLFSSLAGDPASLLSLSVVLLRRSLHSPLPRPGAPPPPSFGPTRGHHARRILAAGGGGEQGHAMAAAPSSPRRSRDIPPLVVAFLVSFSLLVAVPTLLRLRWSAALRDGGSSVDPALRRRPPRHLGGWDGVRMKLGAWPALITGSSASGCSSKRAKLGASACLAVLSQYAAAAPFTP